MTDYKNYNVWPSFVDLSISFVVLLTLILSALIYKTAENKKKYDKVSQQQLKMQEEAKELLNFSLAKGDSNFLSLSLDSSKTMLIISLKKKQEIIFNSGSIKYTYKKKAELSITALLDILKKFLEQKEQIIGRIMVEGHTDERPIKITSKNEFRSNWELSAARAGKLVREFLGDNKDGPLAKYYNKFLAVGYANTQPTGKGYQNDRRISIKITTATAEKLASNFAITDSK